MTMKKLKLSRLPKYIQGWIIAQHSKIHTAGECPCCGSKQLDYPDGGEILDDNVVYKWDCDKCGASGYEGFSMKFEEHTIEDEGNSQQILIEQAKKSMGRKKRPHAITPAKD
jgi:hypothetical protein